MLRQRAIAFCCLFDAIILCELPINIDFFFHDFKLDASMSIYIEKSIKVGLVVSYSCIS